VNWVVPTIAGIQGTTAILAGALTLVLLGLARSPAMAVGCAVGATVMIANLFLLTFVGRWMLALAAHAGGAHRMGIVAASLKLLFIVTVVALLFSFTSLNAPGFVLGALTQPGAIFIETWRVSTRPPAGTGQRREGSFESGQLH
jgi:hypothetical protein